MGYCINCGSPLEPGDSFCVQCGTMVDGVTVTEDPITAGDANAGFAGQTQVMPQPIPEQTYDTPGSYPNPQQVGGQPVGPTYPPTYPAPPVQPEYNGGGTVAATKSPAVAIGIAAAAVALAAIAIITLFVLRGTPEATLYQVTYETAGGSPVAATQVQEGEQVTMPADPQRDGYVFEGWYEDADYTKPASFPIVADEDIVLYAKWEEASESPESPVGNVVDGGAVDKPSSSTPVVPISGQSPSSGSPQPADKPSTNDGYDTVTISIQGANGDTRTVDIRRKGTSQRVIPDSNTRYITESEARALSDAERCIAWNEIIAASNGYAFKNGGLRSYFNNCSWYHMDSSADGSGNISGAAAANVELLKGMTDSWWFNLATY